MTIIALRSTGSKAVVASAPSEPRVVLGRVDRDCRLIAADTELAALQRDAGAGIGDVLALPQVAAVARLALKLNVAVERPALAASNEQNFSLWVRATPEGEEVALSLEGWQARPAPRSRLASLDLVTQSGAAADEARFEWAADAELRITALSPELAAALGVEDKQGAGLALTRLVRLTEDENGDMPLISALAARRDFAGQPARSRGKDDQELWLDGSVVLGNDGSFQGFSGHVRLANGQARPAAAGPARGSIDQALDGVLRSPLDRIIAEAEQIVDRSDGPLRSDYASYGNDIAAAARHLLSVISAMGDDPEFGHLEIDLGALAAEAVMLVEPAAEERGVALELDARRRLPAVGEERAVIQILVNLIGNAVRHSPERGKVTINFDRGAGSASVIVADQGKGIDPADEQRIFEKFERADEAPGGSGLGLAIARRLARSMGGDVTLDSQAAAGARFILTLPTE